MDQRMPSDREEQRSAYPPERVQKAEQPHGGDNGERYKPVDTFPESRIQDVTAVELSCRDEVDGSSEQAKPCSYSRRMKEDALCRHARKVQLLHPAHEQRSAKPRSEERR